ncbi:winged helix-turn-helix domain-containing protein [Streptomyces sp. NPDC051664]|uniref:winged helix-turn-helix domain-containing protein n=1 Tax=Streptomyces sp. NPDC051664 TaxID=3365668 RepID=UPI0037B92B74
MDPGPGPDRDPPPFSDDAVGGDGVAATQADGWSWQAPARRALDRDDHAIELWKKEVWPHVKASRRRMAPGSSSRTKPDSS